MKLLLDTLDEQIIKDKGENDDGWLYLALCKECDWDSGDMWVLVNKNGDLNFFTNNMNREGITENFNIKDNYELISLDDYIHELKDNEYKTFITNLKSFHSYKGIRDVYEIAKKEYKKFFHRNENKFKFLFKDAKKEEIEEIKDISLEIVREESEEPSLEDKIRSRASKGQEEIEPPTKKDDIKIQKEKKINKHKEQFYITHDGFKKYYWIYVDKEGYITSDTQMYTKYNVTDKNTIHNEELWMSFNDFLRKYISLELTIENEDAFLKSLVSQNISHEIKEDMVKKLASQLIEKRQIFSDGVLKTHHPEDFSLDATQEFTPTNSDQIHTFAQILDERKNKILDETYEQQSLEKIKRITKILLVYDGDDTFLDKKELEDFLPRDDKSDELMIDTNEDELYLYNNGFYKTTDDRTTWYGEYEDAYKQYDINLYGLYEHIEKIDIKKHIENLANIKIKCGYVAEESTLPKGTYCYENNQEINDIIRKKILEKIERYLDESEDKKHNIRFIYNFLIKNFQITGGYGLANRGTTIKNQDIGKSIGSILNNDDLKEFIKNYNSYTLVWHKDNFVYTKGGFFWTIEDYGRGPWRYMNEDEAHPIEENQLKYVNNDQILNIFSEGEFSTFIKTKLFKYIDPYKYNFVIDLKNKLKEISIDILKDILKDKLDKDKLKNVMKLYFVVCPENLLIYKKFTENLKTLNYEIIYSHEYNLCLTNSEHQYHYNINQNINYNTNVESANLYEKNINNSILNIYNYILNINFFIENIKIKNNDSISIEKILDICVPPIGEIKFNMFDFDYLNKILTANLNDKLKEKIQKNLDEAVNDKKEEIEKMIELPSIPSGESTAILPDINRQIEKIEKIAEEINKIIQNNRKFIEKIEINLQEEVNNLLERKTELIEKREKIVNDELKEKQDKEKKDREEANAKAQAEITNAKMEKAKAEAGVKKAEQKKAEAEQRKAIAQALIVEAEQRKLQAEAQKAAQEAEAQKAAQEAAAQKAAQEANTAQTETEQHEADNV